MNIDWQQLTEAAREASQQAYAVYSNFRVGAAVLTGEGRVFVGCNVENISYGLTICAERAAVFAAVVGGMREIVAVVVYTPTSEPTTPCGACRQVLAEFNDNMIIRMVCKGGKFVEHSLAELLPHSFGLD